MVIYRSKCISHNTAQGTTHRCRFRFFLLAVAILWAGLPALTGCSRGGANDKQKPTVPVTVSTAMERDVPDVLATIGTAEASNTVSIRARIGGALTRVAFREGQDVNKGDLLFTIDSRTYQAALNASLAALARDKAQSANAEEEARRYTELMKEEYVTKQQFNQVITNAEALKSTVALDEAAVETARLNLQYCNIRAPLSGRTGNLMVHEGDQIKADDSAMVVINQITPINVSFSVPEQKLQDILRYAGAGLLVEANLPNSKAGSIRGKLNFINNAVDLSTRTILLKASFPNSDKRLWPGQFVTVTLTLTTRPHVIVVPSEAVQTGQKGPYVFVITAGFAAESRSVIPGQENNGFTVIEKGLQKGEQVVTDGQLRLTPGARVQIKPDLDTRGEAAP